MRPDIPLREITTEEVWQEVQRLRTELKTHNHLTFGTQLLTGAVRGILQSPNFISGVSGWQLTPTGSFEGNTGTFRGDLSGNNITGATITGGTIQTATGSGARIVMAGATNSISQYDANNNRIAYLDHSGLELITYTVTYPSLSIENDSGVVMTVSLLEVTLKNASSSNPAVSFESVGTAPVISLSVTGTAGHIRMTNLGSSPTSMAVGDLALINSQLYLYKASNPPGSFHWMSLNPITAKNDLIYGGVGGVPTALAASGTNMGLTLDGSGNVGWQSRVLTFLHLTDAPATYSGQSLKAVRVNVGETALEFYTPSAGVYHEIEPPAFSKQANVDTWQDWDLSGSVPEGTTYVEILIIITPAGVAGVRDNGSALDRFITNPDNTYKQMINMTVAVDSNRVCERYSSNIATTEFTVIGYWT